MIVEYRQYRILVGKMNEFLELYRTEGLPLLKQHLGSPLGFFTIEVGEVGSFVHMWVYSDFFDRDTRRTALHEDARWTIYVPKSQALIVEINTRILNKLDFQT